MRNIRRYLIHTVILVRGPIGAGGTGTDQYGEPLGVATPESLTLPARVEWDNRRVVNQAGEEIVCAGVVYLQNHYMDALGARVALTIGGQDRIIFEGREHPIAVTNRAEGWDFQNDLGAHWEVWIR